MAVETDSPQRIARLTPLPDALARLDALVAPVTSRVVDVSLALGHTLAEDVIVAAPIPPTACALRDGWAVSSDLTIDASGYAPAPLPFALRLDVGEPLPDGADAVAPLDAGAIRDGVAHALAPLSPGEGVLPAAADVAPGATFLPAGRRLGGVEIAVLTAAGVAGVALRAPRLRLVRAGPAGDAVIEAAVGYLARAGECQGGVAVIAAQEDLADALAAGEVGAVNVVGGTRCGRSVLSAATR